MLKSAECSKLPGKLEASRIQYFNFADKIRRGASPSPLLGIYDTENDNIYLHPVIQDLVWIEIDKNTGNYIQGWRLESVATFGVGKFKKGEQLTEAELNNYYSLGAIPRKYSYQGETESYSAHHYLVEMAKQLHRIKHFKGFAIREDKFAWNSATLNLPEFSISAQYKKKVFEKVCQWAITPSLFKAFERTVRAEQKEVQTRKVGLAY